ncbi:hypothetical protein Tco_0944034, partial [Tanacetum coccineum]
MLGMKLLCHITNLGVMDDNVLSTKDDETESSREVLQHLETKGNGDLIVEDVPDSLIEDMEYVDLDAKNMNDNESMRAQNESYDTANLESPDSWSWTLNNSGGYTVASSRNMIDSRLLPKGDLKTRWIRYVPNKVNTFAWK